MRRKIIVLLSKIFQDIKSAPRQGRSGPRPRWDQLLPKYVNYTSSSSFNLDPKLAHRKVCSFRSLGKLPPQRCDLSFLPLIPGTLSRPSAMGRGTRVLVRIIQASEAASRTVGKNNRESLKEIREIRWRVSLSEQKRW